MLVSYRPLAHEGGDTNRCARLCETMSFLLSWERPHTTPGIYTFLGLATLPRFQSKANPLRLLPREMIERIARFAHRDTYLAAWDTGEQGGILPTSIDITRTNDEEDVTLRLLRPLRTGVKYVEITTTAGWYGTCLAFDGLGPLHDFGFQLDYDEFNDALNAHGEICLIKMCDLNVAPPSNYFRIKSLGNDSWTWCTEPVTFGVLVDMDRGCVTFRLNGVDGPCVRFPPGSDWRGGVTIKISEFPTQRKGTPPQDDLPVVVSCATPPVPPSLLEAAANPLTVWGHVGAGSFEDVTDDYAEYN